MTLSLCMIVRDEAARIGECLRSVRALVDEAVVVDTGSSDQTAALARDEGARVVSCPWENDFAAARNRSIAEATGDWILALDADERLYPRHFVALRRLMESPWAVAVQLFVRNYTANTDLLNWQPIDPAQAESQGYCGYFDSPQVRLFRRREGIRFDGIVHETVLPSLAREGVPVYRADVLVHHYKESRPEPEKAARNRLILELGRRRTEAEPADAETWRQCALAALDLGECAEAVASLERACALEPERRDLVLYRSMALLLAARPAEAREVCREALDRFPDEPELVQAYGEALLAEGRTGEAREAFARSLELDAYLYRSLAGLAAIAIREDRESVAVEYYAKAKSIHPGLDLPYVNLGLFYLRKGRLGEALDELRRAFAINPRRWQSLAGLGAVLFEMERFAEARDWYRKAAEIAGCSPAVHARLSACCTALGLADEAKQYAEKAAAASPSWQALPAMIRTSLLENAHVADH